MSVCMCARVHLNTLTYALSISGRILNKLETVGKGSAGLKWKENVLSLDITLHDSKILQQNIFILLLKA